MEDHLSTKQVAKALGASESSVKRWCDRGAIPTTKTLGGHRRIPLAGFLEFLKESNRKVVVPLSSLPSANTEETPPSLESLQKVFAKALEDWDEPACRQALTQAYASTESIALLADQFIAATFHQLGDKWDCGQLHVYQERRGCEICVRILQDFRRLLPTVPETAPLALGGTPSGDNYGLPTQLADLVLQECNWKTMNLGCNLPLETVLAAVQTHRPRLVWLSVSHLQDSQAFVKEYQAFYRALPEDVMVVLGGRALNDKLRPNLSYTGFCDNMLQLTSLATALHGPRQAFSGS